MALPKPDIKAKDSMAKLTGGELPLGIHAIDLVKHNPLDVFARIALAENYDRERISANELHISIPSEHTDLHITFSWAYKEETLQLFLVFDGKLPTGRSENICRLLSLVNERLTAGHFDYWSKDDALIYRHSQRLSGQARLNPVQAMDIIADARMAANVGYPAFQYMIWAGLTPEEALEQAMYARAEAQN